MTTIKIPKVESLDNIGDPLEQVLTVFHFLLTALLQRDRALLHTEHRPPAGETVWYLRDRTGEREGEDEKLIVLPSAFVSSCAARLAVALGINHAEGGYGHCEMSQEGRRHDCRVFLSKCKDSGYWIRVYGRRQKVE